MLSPVPFFRMFRYIHMQHHRFTNDGERDPDHYAGRGSKWLLPLRWATLDLSESRVSQIHSQAILRLRARMTDWIAEK